MAQVENTLNWAREPEIPQVDLRDRGVYRLVARGIPVGIWQATGLRFLGYKAPYLEYEYEWHGNGLSGTASAVEYLGQAPDGLEFRTNDPAVCHRHGRLTTTHRHETGDPVTGGYWYSHHHLDDDTVLAKNDQAYLPPYEAMLAYLVPLAEAIQAGKRT